MRKIKTKYEYREGWQYQDIYVDLDTLNIIREQNHKLDGIITHTTDILTTSDKGYHLLWVNWGKPAILELLKDI